MENSELDTEVIANLAEVIEKWSTSKEPPNALGQRLISLTETLKSQEIILRHKIEENLLRVHITFDPNGKRDRYDLRSTGSRYYQIDLNNIPDWLNDIPEYNATKFIVEG
jgi:hypothetical protein